jgi:hypothetical protein
MSASLAPDRHPTVRARADKAVGAQKTSAGMHLGEGIADGHGASWLRRCRMARGQVCGKRCYLALSDRGARDVATDQLHR